MGTPKFFKTNIMKQFNIICIFQFIFFYPTQESLRIFSSTDGIACETTDGEYGICTKWQSCYGARRRDKGNSYHCSRFRTCCTSEYTDPNLREKSYSSRMSKFNVDRNAKHYEDYKEEYDEYPIAPRPIPTPKRSSSLPPSTPSPSTIPNLRVRGCGKRRTLTDFVIGGRVAEYWPWMAAIFFRPEGSRTSTFQCGGTIISKRYILTAAHCLRNDRTRATPPRITVRVGGLTPQGDGHVRRVAEIIIHPNYRTQLHYDDIAILRLTQNIESKNVVPACLPSPGMYNSNFYQRNATVLGWGITDISAISTSTTLREAMVPIISPTRCKKKYEKLNALSLPRGIVDTHICAGTTDGSRDACQGDSGGPLILQDKSQIWNVVGVVSFGYGCGEPEYPGVYTKVAKYLPWLARNTDISTTRDS